MSISSTIADIPDVGWRDLMTGRNAAYSAALAGGVMLHAINIYMVTTVMPSIVNDIGGLEYYTWSTTLFVVASILGSALSVRFLRAGGPRGAYATAATLFAAGTIICSLASTMPALLAGRFLQGCGGGLLYALAYSVIRIVFPASLWSRAIGLISAVWGVSTLLGPAVGGVFAEYDVWRAAFWSLLPIVGVFGVIAFSILPKREGEVGDASALPVLQLALLTGSVVAVSAGSVGNHVVWSIAGLVVALGLVALLVAVERRSVARLLPAATLTHGSRLGAIYSIVALLVIGLQPDVFVPYFLQVLHDQPPLLSGYLAALTAMGWALASMLSSRRSGVNALDALRLGPIGVLLGLIALAVTLPVDSGGNWFVLAPACIGLFILGFGIGTAWPHLVTSVFRNAPASEQDLAAGGMTTIQLFATALGAAMAGMIANAGGIVHPGGVEGASVSASWLLSVFALAPAIALAATWRFTCRERSTFGT